MRVTRVRNVWVNWGDGLRLREDPREQGLIVDRGAFDLGLVEGARSHGVKVLQPARVVDRRQSGGRWRLAIDVDGRRETLEADFLADAGGRAAASGRPRVSTGAPTLAIYAYWRGARLPSTPRIEAGEEAWFWGVPLPNGTYNALAFVDPEDVPGRRAAALERRFLDRLAGSLVLEDCRESERIGPVRRSTRPPISRATASAETQSAWETRRWPSIRSHRAAFKKPFRARSPAPSSPTPCCAGPMRPILRSISIAPS